MIKCTDKIAKAGKKVLDSEIYHDWIVIRWEYELDPTTLKVRAKEAKRFMCKNCGKVVENYNIQKY